jgi:hypothetical protein
MPALTDIPEVLPGLIYIIICKAVKDKVTIPLDLDQLRLFKDLEMFGGIFNRHGCFLCYFFN